MHCLQTAARTPRSPVSVVLWHALYSQVYTAGSIKCRSISDKVTRNFRSFVLAFDLQSRSLHREHYMHAGVHAGVHSRIYMKLFQAMPRCYMDDDFRAWSASVSRVTLGDLSSARLRGLHRGSWSVSYRGAATRVRRTQRRSAPGSHHTRNGLHRCYRRSQSHHIHTPPLTLKVGAIGQQTRCVRESTLHGRRYFVYHLNVHIYAGVADVYISGLAYLVNFGSFVVCRPIPDRVSLCNYA
jgi:hypothetical protein